MGFINDTSSSSSGSGERGQRGLAGRGIESITTVDNNDGSINLTFNYDDGSEPATFVNTLVSDTLIQLDKLTLEGTNMTEKFVVQSSDETRVLTVNTTTKSINLLNPLTATAPTVANSIVNKAHTDPIQTTANTAITNASTAQTTANTANSTANTALTNANTAITNASTAQTTANTALAYLNQNVKTTSTPSFVGIQLPSTQTSPLSVSGKLILTTNPGGDLIGVLPNGRIFPIGGQTMPFFSFDETVTAFIYTEPSANLFSILWDAPSRSAAIAFTNSTYYGSTIINVVSNLTRRTSVMDSTGMTSIGYFWGIVAGASMFLATSSTTAPTGTLQMTSSGMHMWSEIYPNIVSSGGLPYPVFRITIRMGTTGATCNIRWLYV